EWIVELEPEGDEQRQTNGSPKPQAKKQRLAIGAQTFRQALADAATDDPQVAFESDRVERAPLGRQTGRRDPPQRARLRRCSRRVCVCGHWRLSHWRRNGPRCELALARERDLPRARL